MELARSSRSSSLVRSSCTFGRLQRDFDNLIAARVLARIEHTLFAQAELLAVLRALRNLQQRAAVDGGHFDLGAQAASRYVTGTVISISSPSRWKNGCGSTRIVM